MGLTFRGRLRGDGESLKDVLLFENRVEWRFSGSFRCSCKRVLYYRLPSCPSLNVGALLLSFFKLLPDAGHEELFSRRRLLRTLLLLIHLVVPQR